MMPINVKHDNLDEVIIKGDTIIIPTYYYHLMHKPNDNILAAILFSKRMNFTSIYENCVIEMRNYLLSGNKVLHELLSEEIKQDICNVTNRKMKCALLYIMKQPNLEKVDLSYFTFSKKLYNIYKNYFPQITKVRYCASLECLKILHNEGAIIDETTLRYAMNNDQYDCVDYMSMYIF